MGNQVTTLGHIYPIEYYLADYGSDFVFDANLGSTRFMKVARVRHRDAGYCVVKVYAIHDASSLPIQEHRQQVEHIRDTLRSCGDLNSLPFVRCLTNDKCIILLRQYVKYNLYDRLSTRPFLTSIEKRWIAYQLLHCIQLLHKRSICHGDIKSENVLISSFLWVSMADFASYKPVTLPEDNPSDYSYFFDASRRQCCNMAPERFVASSSPSVITSPTSETAPGQQQQQLQQTQAVIGEAALDRPQVEAKPTCLSPQMDLFSLGCVLGELFAEDTANSTLFDLGLLLMYKEGRYEPSATLEKNITDSRARRLILNLTELDPNKRNSAAYHLEQLTPSLFPAYFVTLYEYFCSLIPLSPDSKITTMNESIDSIMSELITEDDHGLLLPLIVITSTLRALKLTISKLTAINLCLKLVESSPRVMSEYIIDRLLPYFMYLIADKDARVRALAIQSLNRVLKHVDHLPASDSNVFIDYILPSLTAKVSDESVMVRITLATSLADLSETARRFMDLSCEKNFDLELSLLQDSFQMIATHLFTDQNNAVRRALLKSNIAKLCHFFGRSKTNDVVLSHVITFLNEKNDHRLRAAFFDTIASVGAYLGPYFSAILKPLMQQGLADSDEMTICKCLNAISSMTQLGLFSKNVVYELYQEAVPLLSFPNKWIRNAMVNFVVILGRVASPIDFNRRILPAIRLHLRRDIHGLKNEALLFDSLHEPIPRPVIESILYGNDIDKIFHSITKRMMLRNSNRYSSIRVKKQHSTCEMTGETIHSDIISESEQETQQVQDTETSPSSFEKDGATLIDRLCEDRLIDSEILLRRIHKNKRAVNVKCIESLISIRCADTKVYKGATRDSSDHLGPNSTYSHGDSQTLGGIDNGNLNTRPAGGQGIGGAATTKGLRTRGILIAHLHEHKRAINRLLAVPNTSIFLSCSSDATIKTWDCTGILTKPNVLFRSKRTFTSPDGDGIIRMAYCSGADTLVALTDQNNLHYLRLGTDNYSSPSPTPSPDKQQQQQQQTLTPRLFRSTHAGPNLMVDVVSTSPFTYAHSLTTSVVTGHDLRQRNDTHAWTLQLDPSDGLITCLDGNESYLSCGTSSSVLALFDLRFLLRATSMSFPPFQERIKKRIRRLQIYNNEIYCSIDGNNEVSVWDCESGTRTKTLWASNEPCLSQTRTSQHTVLSLLVDSDKDTNSVITGSTDMRLRFWDLVNPQRSFVLGQSQARRQQQQHQQQPSTQPTSAQYRLKLIEGIQVIQELDGQIEDLNCHRDFISDIASLGSSNLIVSASRDGVINLWR